MKTARFSIPEICRKQMQSGDVWMEFFDTPALSMGIYRVPAGTDDQESHTPHDRDEVYIGVSGKGCITVDGEQSTIGPDTIVYVKAGVEHHFHNVTEYLNMLVLFAG